MESNNNTNNETQQQEYYGKGELKQMTQSEEDTVSTSYTH